MVTVTRGALLRALWIRVGISQALLPSQSGDGRLAGPTEHPLQVSQLMSRALRGRGSTWRTSIFDIGPYRGK